VLSSFIVSSSSVSYQLQVTSIISATRRRAAAERSLSAAGSPATSVRLSISGSGLAIGGMPTAGAPLAASDVMT
jgi:hypothetical protein